MLLTISTTRTDAGPASDLGYLLHKHPDRAQAFEVAAGRVHVFYPESDDQRCTAAVLLEVDPIALVRGRSGKPREGSQLGHYINDRPYAASSLLSNALVTVFRTAMTGRCNARPRLAAEPIPLEVHVPVLPCRGGAGEAERIFAPLGWAVQATPIPLDQTVPAWGDSGYVDLHLHGRLRLADALNHLYVLLPVLDDAKHYWVGTDEVDKLIRRGEGWLAGHPERDVITRRYLAHLRDLTDDALSRLAEPDDAGSWCTPTDLAASPVNGDPRGDAAAGHEPDQPEPLAVLRQRAVLDAVRAVGAHRVADLGCGEGALLEPLLADPSVTEVVATDVSARALATVARRLHLDQMPAPTRARLKIFQSALTYRDARLAGLDAAVLMEVVEHIDPERLPAFERVVFGEYAPATVVLTTPNAEYNVAFDGLAPGQFRHRDHRFEWTRTQFGNWGDRVAREYGYDVAYRPVGRPDPQLGPPTQLAVFDRRGGGRRGAVIPPRAQPDTTETTTIQAGQQ